MRGNEEWLCGAVDLGPLLQSSKDQRVWVEGLGDLVNLELATMAFFYFLGELTVLEKN